MADKLVVPQKDVRNLYRGIRLCSTIKKEEREKREIEEEREV